MQATQQACVCLASASPCMLSGVHAWAMPCASRRTRRRGYAADPSSIPAAGGLQLLSRPQSILQQGQGAHKPSALNSSTTLSSLPLPCDTRGIAHMHAACAMNAAPVARHKDHSSSSSFCAIETLGDTGWLPLGNGHEGRHGFRNSQDPLDPSRTPTSPNQTQHNHQQQQLHSHIQHRLPDAQRNHTALSHGQPQGDLGTYKTFQRLQDMQMSRKIKACSTWQSLWHLFQENQHLFNHVHTTAVAGGLARTRPGHAAYAAAEEEEFVRCTEEVLSSACPYLPVCQPRELSTLAWAAAKTGAWTIPPSPAPRPAKHSMQSMPQHVSNISNTKGSNRSSTTNSTTNTTTMSYNNSSRGSRIKEMLPATGTANLDSRAAGGRSSLASGTAWWDLMLGTMLPLLPKFNPQDLSMAIWAVARACGAGNPSLQGALFPSTLTAQHSSSSNSSSQDVQPRALGLQQGQGVTRGRALVVKLPAGFLEAVVGRMGRSMGSFGPQALSNSLWALASLRCRPNTRWLHAFVAASAAQMPHAAPQALANTAWALTLMEAPLTPAWCTAFLSATAAAAPAAAPASLAQTLWAAARLKLEPPAAWVEAVVASLLACWGAQASASAAAALSPGDSDLVAPGSKASMLQASKEGLHVPKQFETMSQVRPALQQKGKALQAGSITQDLANAVFAVAQLGRKGTQPHPQVMHDLLHACSGRAYAFPVHELAAVITACGVARFHPSKDVLAPLLSSFAGRMNQAGSQAVANVLWAVARLGVAPPASWVEACVSTLVAEVGDVGPQEVANVWWALGVLRYRPPSSLCVSLAAELRQQVETMKAEEVAMVLAGHARLSMPLKKEVLDSLMSCLVAQQQALWSSPTREAAASAKHNLASALSALAFMECNNKGSSSSSSGQRAGVGSKGWGEAGAGRGKGLGASGSSQRPAIAALLKQCVRHDRGTSSPNGHLAQQTSRVAQQQQQQQQQRQDNAEHHQNPQEHQHRAHMRHPEARAELPSPAHSAPMFSVTQGQALATLHPAFAAYDAAHTAHGPAQQDPVFVSAAQAHPSISSKVSATAATQGGATPATTVGTFAVAGHPAWLLRGHAWTCGDLAVVLYALARLRITPPKEWTQAALTKLSSDASEIVGSSTVTSSSLRSSSASGSDGGSTSSNNSDGGSTSSNNSDGGSTSSSVPLYDLSMLAWSVARLCQPTSPTSRAAVRQSPTARQQHCSKANARRSGVHPLTGIKPLPCLRLQQLPRRRERLRLAHPSNRPPGRWSYVEGRAWALALLPLLAAAPEEEWHRLGMTPLLSLSWAASHLWPARRPGVNPTRAPTPVAQAPPHQAQPHSSSLQRRSSLHPHCAWLQELPSSPEHHVRALLVAQLQRRMPSMPPIPLCRALTALHKLLPHEQSAPHPIHAHASLTNRAAMPSAATAPEATQAHLQPPSARTSAASPAIQYPTPLGASLPQAALPHPPTSAHSTAQQPSLVSTAPSVALPWSLAAFAAPPLGSVVMSIPLHSFDARALCHLVHALGRLQAPVSPSWLLAVCVQLQAMLQPQNKPQTPQPTASQQAPEAASAAATPPHAVFPPPTATTATPASASTLARPQLAARPHAQLHFTASHSSHSLDVAPSATPPKQGTLASHPAHFADGFGALSPAVLAKLSPSDCERAARGLRLLQLGLMQANQRCTAQAARQHHAHSASRSNMALNSSKTSSPVGCHASSASPASPHPNTTLPSSQDPPWLQQQHARFQEQQEPNALQEQHGVQQLDQQRYRQLQQLVLQQAAAEVQYTCLLLKQARAEVLQHAEEARFERRVWKLMRSSYLPKQKTWRRQRSKHARLFENGS